MICRKQLWVLGKISGKLPRVIVLEMFEGMSEKQNPNRMLSNVFSDSFR